MQRNVFNNKLILSQYYLIVNFKKSPAIHRAQRGINYEKVSLLLISDDFSETICGPCNQHYCQPSVNRRCTANRCVTATRGVTSIRMRRVLCKHYYRRCEQKGNDQEFLNIFFHFVCFLRFFNSKFSLMLLHINFFCHHAVLCNNFYQVVT